MAAGLSAPAAAAVTVARLRPASCPPAAEHRDPCPTTMFDRNLETTVDILAPAEVVWAVLTDTAAWPEWNPILKCEGRFEQGQRLEVTAHLPGRSPQTFKPTVLTGECTEGRAGWHLLPGTADEARSILQVSPV